MQIDLNNKQDIEFINKSKNGDYFGAILDGIVVVRETHEHSQKVIYRGAVATYLFQEIRETTLHEITIDQRNLINENISKGFTCIVFVPNLENATLVIKLRPFKNDRWEPQKYENWSVSEENEYRKTFCIDNRLLLSPSAREILAFSQNDNKINA